MAKAIAARTQGDDYQARWFWYEACRLFLEHTHVERVVYEDENIKSLDDVAVYYCDGMIDEYGHPLQADYYQVKFHVTAAGAFTWQSMMDPALSAQLVFRCSSDCITPSNNTLLMAQEAVSSSSRLGQSIPLIQLLI